MSHDIETVAQFLQESDLIKRQIDHSLKLVTKLQEELRNSRECLKSLASWAPSDSLKTTTPFCLRARLGEAASMNTIIKQQISNINHVLGDPL
jgi:hypothetical protein